MELEDEQQRRERVGRDEMNLADLPFATLSRRPDQRTMIVHDTWTTDRDGVQHKQRWQVGAGPLGLPTEYDERVYVALMKLTHEQGFQSRRVEFNVHEVLQVMGLNAGAHEYQDVEMALKRLVGVTIYAEGSFWDNAAKKWRSSVAGFHILDKFWLRSREPDALVREAEGCAAYVVWGEDIWKSFQARNLKRLNLDLFYGLDSALARRLYRFLDKRMRYQAVYEIDIFELAGRLGMTSYRYPAQVKQKLTPAIEELKGRGWLTSAEVVKHGEYTRMHFERTVDGQRSEEMEEPGQVEVAKPDPLAELWARVLGQLRQMTTRATYEALFPQTQLVALAGGRATVQVPDESVRARLANRLEGKVREALAGCGAVVEEVVFEVAGR